MSTEIIETRPSGICNFDYFSADIAGKELTLNGRTFSLGQITLDIVNLPKEFVGELLRKTAVVTNAGRKVIEEEYSEQNLHELRDALFDVLLFIEKTPPFSYFDVADSRRSVDAILSARMIAEYSTLFRKFEAGKATEEDRASDAARRYSFIPNFARVYVYLGSDVANFSNFAQNLTEVIVQNDFRKPEDFAGAALAFCTDPKTAKRLRDANPFPYTEGVSFRPHTSTVPAIPMSNETNAPKIVRRTYYGRLMDFLMADLMGAYEVGHYVYRCRVCNRYFLMTSARKQYYCQTINPALGAACANVAKNRQLRPEEAKEFKQSKKDNPLYVLYSKQCAVIRKRKQRGSIGSAEAKKEIARLKSCFKKAMTDAHYAKTQYENDLKDI